MSIEKHSHTKMLDNIPWSDVLTKKMSNFFEKEHIQYAIRSKILDPILNYVLNKIFPYVMLICIMFVLLLVSVLVTLCVMIFKFRAKPEISIAEILRKETEALT
jgi:hypothetical protein